MDLLPAKFLEIMPLTLLVEVFNYSLRSKSLPWFSEGSEKPKQRPHLLINIAIKHRHHHTNPVRCQETSERIWNLECSSAVVD